MSNYQEGSGPYSEGMQGSGAPNQEPSPGGAGAYQGGPGPQGGSEAPYETSQYGSQGGQQQWDQQAGYQGQGHQGQGHQGQGHQGHGFLQGGNPMGASGRSNLKVRSTFKSTEFWVLVVVALGVLLAAAVTDDGVDGVGFGAHDAWKYITWLAIAYIVSRGLTKFGGNEPKRGTDHQDRH